MQPAAVSSRNNALCAEYRAKGDISKPGECRREFSFGEFFRRFASPALEYIVCMMMVMMIVTATVTVFAVVVMMFVLMVMMVFLTMMMFMLVVMVVFLTAMMSVLVVMMVLVTVMMFMLMVMVVFVAVMMFMLVVMMVLVTVMMFMLMVMMVFVFMMMRVLSLNLLEQFRGQGVAFRHGFEQLCAGQFIPWRSDDTCICIVSAKKGDTFFQLVRLHVLGTAQNHRTCVLNLIIKKLAEVFHIHFSLGGICDRHECIQLDRLMFGNALYSMDNIREFTNPRRFD